MPTFLTSFFANPALLGGAAAGSIPIIIHLLNRQKFKKVIWGAMHWLWASFKKSQRRLQIEQLILLLIRILLLVLLAFALARPALQQGLGLISGSSTLHRVIILDNSYSMGQKVGGKALFESAKDRAREMVSKLSAADEVNVLLANTIVEELTANSQSPKSDVENLIKDAKLSDGGTELPLAVAHACRLLNERNAVRKEIIIITDQTRLGWENPDRQPHRISGEDEAIVEKAFAPGKVHPKIMVVRLAGEPEGDNLAAVKLIIEEKVVPANVETQIVGTITNYSRTSKKARAKLSLDGMEIAAEDVKEIAPGKSETVTFRYLFPEAGSHALSLDVNNDRLSEDDTAYLAIDVEEQMRVLCVDGDQSTQPNLSEMDYFRQALSPSKSEEANAGKMPLFPDVKGRADFIETNLDPYRLIVLGNVSVPPPEKIQALRDFVKRGGALWIFVGHNTDAKLYNNEFGDLLPGTLEGDGGTADITNPDAPFEAISDKFVSHPAIEKFQGMKTVPLSELRTHRRFKLNATPADETVRTILQYENGDAAALEKRVGDSGGRVVLFGTTADKAWNNWPVKAHYMMLMNFIALDLIQPPYLQRNRNYGERFVMQLPRQVWADARRDGVRLKDPANEVGSMEVFADAARMESKPIRRAGIYSTTLPVEPKATTYFAANRNTEESDLATIEDNEIMAMISRGEGEGEQNGYFKSYVTQSEIVFASDDLKDAEEKLKQQGGSREIWRWLAGTVLALLLIESFLARRFGDFTR
jgi:hypothetical protein